VPRQEEFSGAATADDDSDGGMSTADVASSKDSRASVTPR